MAGLLCAERRAILNKQEQKQAIQNN